MWSKCIFPPYPVLKSHRIVCIPIRPRNFWLFLEKKKNLKTAKLGVVGSCQERLAGPGARALSLCQGRSPARLSSPIACLPRGHLSLAQERGEWMVEAGLWASSWGGGPTPCSTSGTHTAPAKARRHQHKKHRIRGLEFGPNRGTGRLRFLPVLSQGPFPVCTASGQGDAQGWRGSGRGVWVLSAVRTSRARDGRGRSWPTGTRSSHRTKAGGAAGRRPGALT